MLQTIPVQDFTGGLNYRADVFQLADNESPDLLNVDIDPRGGFSSRQGMRQYGDVVQFMIDGTFRPRRLYSWYGNTNQLILCADTVTDGKVYYTENGTWTDTTIPCTFSEGASIAPWSNSDISYLYFATGIGTQGHKWDGTTATALTASGAAQWQDSFAAPTGTHMPTANLATTHVDRLWVANTREDENDFPDRVRFSHPGFPESWRELDYIDVVGGGRGITALVSFGDQLLVFKRSAVYAILGYDEETFQVVPLTTTLGCVSSNTVAVSEQGVFFFSWPDGLFVYNGQGFADLFVPLRPLITSGELSQSSSDDIFVSWVDRKVHVSLPIGNSPFGPWPYNGDVVSYPGAPLPYDTYSTDEIKYDGDIIAFIPTSTFVWDSTIREGGAWTQYQTADGFGLIGGADFVDADGKRVPVCAHPYLPYVLKINQQGYHTDFIGGGESTYDSYYITKWQDADIPAAKKFWRRPEIVLRQFSEETTIDVDVYHNWDKSAVDRQFSITLDAVSVGGGGGSWVSPDLGSDLAKGNNLGLARSVQLKISGTGQPWGVNGISYKYNPRRVRL